MAATKANPITLGLDVGGTRIKAMALEAGDRVLETYEGPSEAKSGPEAVRRAIGFAVEHFKRSGIKVEALGIGVAGSVEPVTGLVRNCPNFSSWSMVPLKSWIETDWSLPVTVDNDANCATFAEFKAGNAKDCQNAVLLTLGTGIGAGLIINGSLFRGATGTAGELGHFSIYADGKPCTCGNQGCFERYCSASALRESAGGKYSAREIFLRSNEDFFKKIIATFLRDFQIGLVSIANTFDPECILLGGAVTQGVANYFPEIRAWIRAHAFPAVAQKMVLDKAKHGNLSGAMGAAYFSREML